MCAKKLTGGQLNNLTHDTKNKEETTNKNPVAQSVKVVRGGEVRLWGKRICERSKFLSLE